MISLPCPSADPASAIPTPALPQGEAVIAAAALRGLAIPPACMPGVLANLALLERHAATLLERAAPTP